MIKACIFDLDGTLLNTLFAIRYFANLELSREGLATIDEEKTKRFVGEGAKELILRCIENAGILATSERGKSLFSRIHPSYVKKYNDNPDYLTEPYEGVPEVLAYLKEKGMRLGVLSNKPSETVKSLCEKFFGNIFDFVEGAREGIPLKPSPEAAYEACRALGVAPSETAYFGDTATDMKTAKNYGAGISVGVLWGFRDREELLRSGADRIISSPCQIKELL